MEKNENFPEKVYVITYLEGERQTNISGELWKRTGVGKLESERVFFEERIPKVSLRVFGGEVTYNMGPDVGKMHNGMKARVTEYDRVISPGANPDKER